LQESQSRQTHAVTYRELNERANTLAYILQSKGVKPGAIVAIMLDRSIEMIIGLMAILKAGSAYLPIDPGYPEERINYMLKDSSAGLVLVDDKAETRISKFETKPTGPAVLNLENLEFEFISDFGIRVSDFPSEDAPAYIIYTSGTSGKPKGVMIAHPSVINTLFALQEKYPFTDRDVYLFKTSHVFDVSVTEIFGWYLGAGKLAILEKGGEKDPEIIVTAIEKQHVTHINFVPSMFNVFVENLDKEAANKLSGLKNIFLAGEALLAGEVEKFQRLGTGIPLENIYGPTEATIYATWYSLTQWSRERSTGSGIPIGKPLPNLKINILDKYGNHQPEGVTGELCIAGDGLAYGYLNQPELTFEKFTPHERDLLKDAPSFPNNQYPITNNHLYRTGDLAGWQADGNIKYLGRI
ncbi:MAG: amino acid adenylation domain-containing protein, partial [bacterium]|nr:amino acid adenylation domain-containing protein [bacterium]